MKKEVFIVTDLGGGDGGKGGVVHKISSLKGAHTVVKVGGAQGSHGVRTSSGQKFNFSQFGCGTFEGARTHISKLMLVEPYLLLREAGRLKNEWGIYNIFDYLTIDENALCITPYHTFASRLRELDRKDKPKGTVGIGAGEAVLDSETHPKLTIRVKDLNQPHLKKILEAVREKKINDLAEIITRVDDLLPEDKALAKEHIELLFEDELIDRIVETFNSLGRQAKIVDSDYLTKKILSQNGTVVIESSHGVLTDRYHGFHPHTTKIRSVPVKTLEMLKDCNYDGEIFKIGVTRAYQIRQGAGPMVTESPGLLETLLPGSSKEENRWQGKERVGPLDLVSLRYSIEVCGGPEFFSGLVVNWFDQIQKNGKWEVCNRYSRADDTNFFTPDGEIKVRRGSDEIQLQYQEELGKQLNKCRPGRITKYDVSQKDQKSLVEFCSEILEDKLGIPVKMISFGPAEKDKICL